MKGKATSSFALLFVVGIILVVFATSCSKSSTTTPSFIGTYYGKIGGSLGNGDTIIITAGGSSSSVVMVSRTSIGSVYTIDGTVSGTALTIPLQAYTYYTATDTVQGSGTLSGSTLSINFIFSNASGVNNLNFLGTRQ